MVPVGYLAARYSARTVILVAASVGAVAIYTFLGFPNHNPSVVLCLLFICGLSLGLVNPVSLIVGSNMVPRHPGMISAFLMGLAWCVAEAVGPMGAGMMATLFSEDPAGRALALLGLLYFVSWGCIYAFREETIEADSLPQLEVA